MSDEDAAFAAEQWGSGRLSQRQIAMALNGGTDNGSAAICIMIEHFIRRYAPGVKVRGDNPSGYAPGKVQAQGEARRLLAAKAAAAYRAAGGKVREIAFEAGARWGGQPKRQRAASVTDLPTGDLLDLPVESLGPMTTRLHAGITYDPDIKTVRDLIARRAIDFMRIPNMGRASVQELKELLAEHGLALASDYRSPPALAFPTLHDRLAAIEAAVAGRREREVNMTDDELEDLLDGLDPSGAAVLFERTAERVDTDEFAAVLTRLAEFCRAYAARIAPSAEA